MVLNPYFQQGASSEQNLVQDLINEQLKMYGVEIHYLPRKYATETSVIREVIQSNFDDAYPIEAYVDTFDGYAENPVLLSKFGIEATNDITLTISKERYENYISPLLKNESNVRLTTRPKEGDLIYFPLGDRLFEIKYVEHEKPFYQLQKNYIYTLRCELFRYEDEVIDTGIEEIDNELIGDETDGMAGADGTIPTVLGPSQTLTLVGLGLTAAASVVGVATTGGIMYTKITNRGGGYISPPYIGISSAPTGGLTGIMTAQLIGGVQFCNLNVSPNKKSVQRVDIVNPGYAYTVNPGLAVRAINVDGGSGVAVSAFIGDGTLSVISLTNQGSGFSTDPTVTFPAPVGVGTTATAVAIINGAGKVVQVRYTNAGAGYTAGDLPVYATFSDPAMDSTGNFVFNEIITGAASSTTARVRVWNSDTSELEVATVTGTFLVGEKIIGSTSKAVHTIRLTDVQPLEGGYADNFDIETEADKILDFSEQNPFGIP